MGEWFESVAGVDVALRIMQTCSECKPKAEAVLQAAGRGHGKATLERTYPCDWCRREIERSAG